MAHSGVGEGQPHDLKVNLIYPCTEQHIKKYTAQAVRYVTETPAIYRDHVRPFMQDKRDQGRLNWVFNILDGRTEQEDVLFRSPHESTPEDERYLLLPDLNWDRKTLGSLHLLALVERRDIWSVRDLKKKHVPWLKRIVADIADTVSRLYGQGVDPDMLKCYVHCMMFLLCFVLSDTDMLVQTSLLTTTFTSTLSTSRSRPVLHRLSARLCRSTTSSHNSTPWLATKKPAWIKSICPTLWAKQVNCGPTFSFLSSRKDYNR